MTAKEIFSCLGYHERNFDNCAAFYEKTVFHHDQVDASEGLCDWKSVTTRRVISFSDRRGVKTVYCYDSDKYMHDTGNYNEYPIALNPLEIQAISMQLDELGWSLTAPPAPQNATLPDNSDNLSERA